MRVLALIILSTSLISACVDRSESSSDEEQQMMAQTGQSSDMGSNVDVFFRDAMDAGHSDAGASAARDAFGVERMSDSAGMMRPVAPIHFGGDRPANYYLPYDYDPDTPVPLLIGLHAFMGNALWHNSYLGLSDVTQEQGILLVMPNGRRNPDGHRFWNATDHCCDAYDQGDVDVAYLAALVDEARRHFNVDPSRIGVFGHSNGAFMGHRLACELSEHLTHVISLAGTSWADAMRCGPVEPVSVLHIHGTWDAFTRYVGQVKREGDPSAVYDFFRCQNQRCTTETMACNENDMCAGIWSCMEECGWGVDDSLCRQTCYVAAEYPAQVAWMEHWICLVGEGCYDNPTLPEPGYSGAEELVSRWVNRNGCEDSGVDGTPLDLIFTLPGVDTSVTAWSAGCARNTEVRFWSLERGEHSPQFNPDFSNQAIQWFLDTPRTLE